MAKKKKKAEVTPFKKEEAAAKKVGLKTFKFKGSRYRVSSEEEEPQSPNKELSDK